MQHAPTLMARNSNLRSLLGALQQRADLAVWSPWSFQCCWAMLSHHDKMDENSSMMHYSKVDVFFGGYFSGYWLSHVDVFCSPKSGRHFLEKNRANCWNLDLKQSQFQDVSWFHSGIEAIDYSRNCQRLRNLDLRWSRLFLQRLALCAWPFFFCGFQYMIGRRFQKRSFLGLFQIMYFMFIASCKRKLACWITLWKRNTTW